MKCPYCDYVAATPVQELRHMEKAHPQVIETRLIEAGFRRDAEGNWVDTLAGDD